jgi:hypothetical protein
MAEEPGTTPPENEPPKPGPPANGPVTPPANGPEGGSPTGADKWTAEQWQQHAHELREENKRRRLEGQTLQSQLDELQTWKSEQERAALSEEERRQVEFDEAVQAREAAEARAAEMQLQYEVAARASTLGIRDPRDAVRLMDWDALEFNDRGEVSNMDNVLTALLTEKPYLRGTVQAITPPPGGEVTPPGGNPSRERQSGSALTMDDIKQMSPAEINANWDEVQKVLAASR